MPLFRIFIKVGESLYQNILMMWIEGNRWTCPLRSEWYNLSFHLMMPLIVYLCVIYYKPHKYSSHMQNLTLATCHFIEWNRAGRDNKADLLDLQLCYKQFHWYNTNWVKQKHGVCDNFYGIIKYP